MEARINPNPNYLITPPLNPNSNETTQLSLRVFEENKTYNIAVRILSPSQAPQTFIEKIAQSIQRFSWKPLKIDDSKLEGQQVLINIHDAIEKLKLLGLTKREVKTKIKDGSLLTAIQEKYIEKTVEENLVNLSLRPYETHQFIRWLSNSTITGELSSIQEIKDVILEVTKLFEEEIEKRSDDRASMHTGIILEILKSCLAEAIFYKIADDVGFKTEDSKLLKFIFEFRSQKNCSFQESIPFAQEEKRLLEDAARNQQYPLDDLSYFEAWTLKNSVNCTYEDMMISAKVQENLLSQTGAIAKSGKEIFADITEIFNIEENRRKAVKALLREEIADYKPFLDQIKRMGPIDVEAIKNDPQAYKSFLTNLAEGSGTVSGSNGEQEAEQALNNILKAEKMIGQWISDKIELSPTLVSSLNECITFNTSNNNGTPGAYRVCEVNVKCESGKYFAGWQVQPEMIKWCEWLDKELKEADGDPLKTIEISARAYGWIISIHPFKDGNGRTCRMLLNFILMKEGIPPCFLSETRGKGALFGDKIQCIEKHIREEKIDDPVKIKELRDHYGTKPEKMMQNILEGIEVAVDKFAKK